MLPLGILIPTRNAADLMRHEIPRLRSLITQVAQAVVVDSSEDGTLELLKGRLRDLEVQFFQQPPGLYSSWNFGIRQITVPYVYISTAGDSITSHGLEHLVETAENLGCDLVVSPPEFRDEAGRALPAKRWPVHDLVARGKLCAPTLLKPWKTFLLQALNAPKALIGSSAANVYRTEALRRFPFPVDYGHFGDVAWGIQNAFRTGWGITPSVVSRFIVHKSGDGIPIQEIERTRAALLALAMETLNNQAKDHGLRPPPKVIEGLRRLPRETSEVWRLNQQFDTLRRGAFPWVLRPCVWRVRRARLQQKRILANLKAELLDAFYAEPDRASLKGSHV